MTNKLHVYTGEGKGKTTAGMGLALRSVGHGNRVLVAQFMKRGNSGELKALQTFPNARVTMAEPVKGFTFRMSEEELIEIAGEDALRQFSDNRGERESLTDPQVLDIILYTLKELEDEGNIRCRCEDGGDYELQFGDEDVFVVCKKCGAEYAVRAGSLSAAQDFLNADSITLT